MPGLSIDIRRSWFVLALTALNVVMFVYPLIRPHSTAAESVVPVLRGRALEIVDDNGKVRAELKIFPPDPKVKMPDGSTGYPETVLLRLISSVGAPNVKIAATEDGSGINLGGASNPTHIQLLARGAKTFVKLTDQDTKQQIVKP